ncbi:hypothetical protein Q8W71_26070 [Methylobacterium sp. NEAU 140]|uniref:hypothetical protein n=1 Tax=Methylobacterium sp. NEAU 140 TaxID=3064945 RepID=UPI002736C0ED|nr:hypothetical protein [Methylobacterium sp. NEAU 140]MDP4026100.1 hypothetical protein [Methylobacterium sp. NEAU 140]
MTAGADRATIAGLVTGAEGGRIAAFLRDGATGFALNPFPDTTAGAARHTWAGQAFEFPLLGIEAAGLSCLLRALAALPASEPLARHILKSPAHTCTVFLTLAGGFVGAVLHGKPGVPLPPAGPEPAAGGSRPRRASPTRQLDLFADRARA